MGYTDDMQKPLSGIKVADLTLAGSGPSCTKLLAEYGADVIWVESPKGTTTRTVHKYDFYTTGKRTIALNLKTPEGMEAVKRIIRDSDVFVSNYRPKGLEHLHLTYEEVKEINPTIIYATITGFGEQGEDADKPGYDSIAFWSRGGLLSDIAEKGSLVVPPVAVGDIATGMGLFGGICAALYGRKQTGKGCHISTSLLATAIYMNHDALIEVQYGEKYPKARTAPRRALFNTYRCRDEQWITIAILDHFEQYFYGLLEVIGRADLIGDPRWKCIEDTMYEHAPELVEILDQGFMGLTQDEAITALNAIDVPVSRVHHTEDLLTDRQVLANHYIYPLEASMPPSEDQKKIMVPCSPIKFGDPEYGTKGHERGPVPGEQSSEILREYGFSDQEIEDMRKRRIFIEKKGE